MMRTLFGAILFTLMLVFIGCSEDDNPADSNNFKKQIVGTWKDGSSEHIFRSDGVYSFSSGLGEGNGTFTIDEKVGKLVLNYSFYDNIFYESRAYTKTWFLELSNSGSTMTWYKEPQRITVAGSFIKQR